MAPDPEAISCSRTTSELRRASKSTLVAHDARRAWQDRGRHMKRALLLFGVMVASTRLATAQTPPPQQPTGKVDAKALMQSGLKLFDAKDYLGALAVFKDAYARFPSAKILLNIGTTQLLLDRKADAANSYQKYLESPDADPARKADVAAQIAELDKASGVLELAITPGDAEVQLGDEWVPASSVKLW